MVQEEYKSLSYEVTEFGSSYMKMLINSTYGLWTEKESIQEKRSNKLKRILNG